MDSSGFELVAAIGATALGVGWILGVLPGLWRGHGRGSSFLRYEPVPEWWLWGPILWHGYVRTIPFVGTALSFWGPVYLAQLLLPKSVSDSDWFVVMLAIALATPFLGGTFIALFGWPKTLIPLPVRNKPGMVREVRTRVEQRTAAKGEPRRPLDR